MQRCVIVSCHTDVVIVSKIFKLSCGYYKINFLIYLVMNNYKSLHQVALDYIKYISNILNFTEAQFNNSLQTHQTYARYLLSS